MEVVSLDTVLFSHVYPEDERLEWSAGRIESEDAALLRVETDDGLVGWSDLTYAYLGCAEAIPGIVDVLERQVVGRNPENVVDIRKDLYDRNVFWARGGLPEGVIGSIEIAMYDLLGKVHGVPAYQLLGGRSDARVRVYGSGGIAGSIEGRVEQAVEYADHGFDIVKIRAVREPMRNVDLVERTLAALDDGVRVALDTVQGSASSPWSVKEAIRLAQALEEYADRLFFYEDPVRGEDVDGLRRVRDATSLRVAAGEVYVGRYEFRHLLDRGAVDVVQPDVGLSGGYAVTRQISGYAASHGVPLAMHAWGNGAWILANLHYAASDPNCEIVEFCQLPNPLRDRLLPDSVQVDVVDGEAHVTLPDEPGLGISSPEGIEDEYEFVPGKGYVFE